MFPSLSWAGPRYFLLSSPHLYGVPLITVGNHEDRMVHSYSVIARSLPLCRLLCNSVYREKLTDRSGGTQWDRKGQH